jgi:hypothetical protein
MRSISKSKALSGVQCARRLWLARREPPHTPTLAQDALSLRRSTLTDAYLENQPDGFRPSGDWAERVAQTMSAIHGETATLQRVCLEAHGIRLYLDQAKRTDSGWQVVEVRGSGTTKPNHRDSAALTALVFKALHLPIDSIHIAHINTRWSAGSGLPRFVEVDFTNKALARAETLGPEVDTLHKALSGDRPVATTGPHCHRPFPCPYMTQCHPPQPEHGIGELYRVKAKVLKQIANQGISQIREIPADIVLPVIAARQQQAVSANEVVVDSELGHALQAIQRPTIYIDFEAIQPALPPWPGCKPFGLVPVQVSLHRMDADGSLSHTHWLADSDVDPRPALAAFLAGQLHDAATLVAYHASFEASVIRQLIAVASPSAAKVLTEANQRFVDLLPVVRNHVYHPDFRGRFGLKGVVEALLPTLSYAGLKVKRGDEASILLEALILHGMPHEASKRSAVRDALLAYCERDTMVMVQLEALLQELSQQEAMA